DEDLAMERLDPRELEIFEVLLGPALGQIARRLRLVCLTKDAERDDLVAATVDELVRHETGLGADLLGEALVYPPRQFVHLPSLHPVAPDACEHFCSFLLRCRSDTAVALPTRQHLLSCPPSAGSTAAGGRGAAVLTFETTPR